MMDPSLHLKLEAIAREYRKFVFWRQLTFLWAGAALAGLIFLAIQQPAQRVPAFVIGLFVMALGSAVFWRRSRMNRHPVDHHWLAQQIEREYPRLDARLLAAIDQSPSDETGQFNHLQRRLFSEILYQERQTPWVQRVRERLFFLHLAHLAAFLCFLLVLAGLSFRQLESGTWIASRQGLTVVPGDTQVERGRSVAIQARFAKKPPLEATLVVTSASGLHERIPLKRDFEDPVFSGAINEVHHDLSYHILFDDKRSGDFTIRTFEYPRLEATEARLKFPQYTGLPERNITQTRRISAVEGTEITLLFQLNKPVVSAVLTDGKENTFSLRQIPDSPNMFAWEHPLDTSQSLELHLTDEAGRNNRFPPRFVLEALPNKPAVANIKFPSGDQRWSPLEEVRLQAEAWDDFGLLRYGLGFALAGEETRYLELGGAVAPSEKARMDHLLELEAFELSPGSLVSWFAWADDIGPDEEERRSFSDIFFSEIRPFEEIFRQGMSGGGEGQQGGGGQGEELLELQKEIISATWNVQRRPRSEETAEQVQTIHQSQAEALQLARRLSDRLQDNPELLESLAAATSEMNAALKSLEIAVSSSSPGPLQEALKSEQAAYQALLKLQSGEFSVTRNASAQGGGSQGNAQRQAQQLNLQLEENRYQTQTQAAPPPDPERREQLKSLSRLREIAQRQQDLNEQLKELQVALSEAASPREREELQRQLKRLQEQQRDILDRLDDLRQRMARNSSPENARSLEQLDQTRDDLEQASQHLESESVSQALASGARGQRQLEDLREDIRQESSSQFAEAARELRQNARDLLERQEQIARELERMQNTRARSLEDSAERAGLARQLEEQTEHLDHLLDQMRSITEEAENSEPLLARHLYDALRNLDRESVEEALNRAARFTQGGFLSEAAELELRAREGLEQLREGIESAADRVLGDQIEALRYARNELDELTSQLGQEIARAARSRSAETGGEDPAGQPSNDPGQPQLAQADTSDETSNGQSSFDQRPENAQASAGQNSPSSEQQSGSSNSEPSSQPSSGATDGARADTSSGSREGGSRGWWNDSVFRGQEGPITGASFGEWADRLRDLEELIDSPDLRHELAQARERAQETRLEYRRHSQEPRWDLVQMNILAPLAQVRDRVAEELARRSSRESLAPVDRDPVPQRYSDWVRLYYEQLSSNRE
jgi:hypothetical protein